MDVYTSPEYTVHTILEISVIYNVGTPFSTNVGLPLPFTSFLFDPLLSSSALLCLPVGLAVDTDAGKTSRRKVKYCLSECGAHKYLVASLASLNS